MYTNHIYPDRRRYFLEKRNEKLKKENRIFDIIQIGDSITENFNLTRYIYLNKTILNSGVGGDLTDTLLLRYEEDSIQYDPKIIILMIGINDIRTFFTKEKHNYFINDLDDLKNKIINNIIKMININEKKGITTIWCNILPLNEFELNSYVINEHIKDINQKIEKQLQNKKNIEILIYDSVINYDGRLNANMTYDGVHPNDDGYMNMALELEALLK